MEERICRIKASARLHFGFLDLHGGMGRHFGSVGMALNTPVLHLRAQTADTFQVSGYEYQKVQKIAELFFQQLDIEPAVKFDFDRTIPEHQGLGSGTQMALVIGHAIAYLYQTGWDSATIAGLAGRGKRSGIGIHSFDHGGFLVDGGKLNDKRVSPLIAHATVPAEWRVILIHGPDNSVGLHGEQERKVFQELPVFSDRCAAYLSRLVLMAILPAIAEKDFATFASAIMELQDKVGDYFSEFQAGSYANTQVQAVLDYLRQQGIKGLGQSSWGPTGFVFAADKNAAEQLTQQIQDEFSDRFAVRLCVTQANNSAAVIDCS